MPPLCEHGSSHSGMHWAADDGFDVASATVLYWKAVPVALQFPDREEHTAELTIRIMSGTARISSASRALRVWLSSEADACFLHALDVGEDDFAGLKAQQGILVDFGGFPGKLIALLDRCVAAARQHQPPRFQAVLSGGRCAGESALQFLETNDFKQLPHLTLAFRPGTDAAVKQFLAFRLGEVISEGAGLASELRTVKADRDATARQLAEAQQQASDAAAACEQSRAIATAQRAAAETAALEAKAGELAALRSQLESERGQAEARLLAQLEASAAKGDRFGDDARALAAAKCELEAEVAELRRRLRSAETGRDETTQEAAELRAAASMAAAERASNDVVLAEARASLAAHAEKVAAQQETLQHQTERMRGLEAAARAAEAQAGELKEAGAVSAARADAAAAEASRAGQAVEKLTADVRVAREKGRRRGALAARQEGELQAARAEVAAVRVAAEAAQRSANAAANDRKRTEAEMEGVQGRLAEARQALEGNDQMIRWLNNQLNEAQLSYSSIGGRFPHRPPGASVPSCFPGRLLLQQRLSYPGSLPTLHHLRTPAVGAFPGGSEQTASSAPPAAGKAAAQHHEAHAAAPSHTTNSSKHNPAREADGDAGGGDGPSRASAWASNAPGGPVVTRDAAPVPRTPAAPEAAPRANPAAAARAATGSSSAAMAAAAFGSGQRPIYRSELARALTEGRDPTPPPGSRPTKQIPAAHTPPPSDTNPGKGDVARNLGPQLEAAGGSSTQSYSVAGFGSTCGLGRSRNGA